MRIFARRVEHAFDITVQCPHDTDARKHRRAAQLCDQDQAFDCGFASGLKTGGQPTESR
jgi:hypothetical protein